MHLPFRRLSASLCGLVASAGHCPDNGARKLALCNQRPFGLNACGGIVRREAASIGTVRRVTLSRPSGALVPEIRTPSKCFSRQLLTPSDSAC